MGMSRRRLASNLLNHQNLSKDYGCKYLEAVPCQFSTSASEISLLHPEPRLRQISLRLFIVFLGQVCLS
jgi:hypothetical protein